jgi:hypothetical protein
MIKFNYENMKDTAVYCDEEWKADKLIEELGKIGIHWIINTVSNSYNQKDGCTYCISKNTDSDKYVITFAKGKYVKEQYKTMYFDYIDFSEEEPPQHLTLTKKTDYLAQMLGVPKYTPLECNMNNNLYIIKDDSLHLITPVGSEILKQSTMSIDMLLKTYFKVYEHPKQLKKFTLKGALKYLEDNNHHVYDDMTMVTSKVNPDVSLTDEIYTLTEEILNGYWTIEGVYDDE